MMNSLFNSKINAVKINASTFTIKTPPETANARHRASSKRIGPWECSIWKEHGFKGKNTNVSNLNHRFEMRKNKCDNHGNDSL